MKKINTIFSIVMVVSMTVVGFCFYMNYKQQRKFETQKTGVSLEEFKINWGKPKNMFIYNDDEIVLTYNKNYFFGEKYVFKFNSKNMSLISKHIDD
jgi:hypothetical protein